MSHSDLKNSSNLRRERPSRVAPTDQTMAKKKWAMIMLVCSSITAFSDFDIAFAMGSGADSFNSSSSSSRKSSSSSSSLPSFLGGDRQQHSTSLVVGLKWGGGGGCLKRERKRGEKADKHRGGRDRKGKC